MSKPWIRSVTKAGSPISSGDTHVMPLAHSICIRPAGLPLGFIWNRPLAVVVRTADGKVREVPVPDITRRRQVMWLAIGLFGSLLLWYIFRK
jgi:hypothetical protein